MQLFEGVKVSRKLLNQAVNDPDMTFGFEAEFYVVGAQVALQELLTKDSTIKDGGEGYGDFHMKKLGDMAWHDVLHFFQPLRVKGRDEKDNNEIMIGRLLDVYQEVTNNHVKKVSPDEMWETLKSKHRVHELMPMLKIFPHQNRIMGVPPSQIQLIHDIVHDGDAEEIQQFGKLNDIDIATAAVGYEEQDYDIRSNEATRDTAYNFISKDLSRQLGEPVLYTMDSNKTYAVSGSYQDWVLTTDGSLDYLEASEDVIGCELVSPKRPIMKGYQDLMNVLQILQNGILGLDVKTTFDTGLHINIGVEGKEIDALKMLILLGDDHIIQKFGRAASEHTGPAYQELITRLSKAAGGGRKLFVTNSRALVQATQAALRDIQIDQSDLTRLTQLMNAMKPEGKSFSVNFSKLPSGYVEFRAIGNANYEHRADDIANAVKRMIVITHIATDPNAYRQEFLKKLYKIVADVMPKEPEKLAASVGYTARQAGMPGGYGHPIEKRPETPYDGENLVQYGFDSGSDTQ